MEIDLISGKKVLYEVFMWNPALIATFLWIFFKDVDYLPIDRRETTGFIIAKKPRKIELFSENEKTGNSKLRYDLC